MKTKKLLVIDFISIRYCATLLEMSPLSKEREQHSLQL